MRFLLILFAFAASASADLNVPACGDYFLKELNIKNQCQLGSCATYSMTTFLEYKAMSHFGKVLKFDPDYTYYSKIRNSLLERFEQLKGEHFSKSTFLLDGDSARSSLENIKKYGIAFEHAWNPVFDLKRNPDVLASIINKYNSFAQRRVKSENELFNKLFGGEIFEDDGYNLASAGLIDWYITKPFLQTGTVHSNYQSKLIANSEEIKQIVTTYLKTTNETIAEIEPYIKSINEKYLGEDYHPDMHINGGSKDVYTPIELAEEILPKKITTISYEKNARKIVPPADMYTSKFEDLEKEIISKIQNNEPVLLSYNIGESGHAVVIVGVKLQKNGLIDYIKIHNSWGKDSGENGFMIMDREKLSYTISGIAY